MILQTTCSTSNVQDTRVLDDDAPDELTCMTSYYLGQHEMLNLVIRFDENGDIIE